MTCFCSERTVCCLCPVWTSVDADSLWPTATQQRNLPWVASQDYSESLHHLQRPLPPSFPLSTCPNPPPPTPSFSKESKLCCTDKIDIKEARVPLTAWWVETTPEWEWVGGGQFYLGWLTDPPSSSPKHLSKNAASLLTTHSGTKATRGGSEDSQRLLWAGWGGGRAGQSGCGGGGGERVKGDCCHSIRPPARKLSSNPQDPLWGHS